MCTTNNSCLDTSQIVIPTGADGVGVTSIVWTSSTGGATPAIAGATDTYTITYSDTNTTTYTVINGTDGAAGATGAIGVTGNGIASTAFTSSTGGATAGIVGATDTYTITYTDATTSTFVVTNGAVLPYAGFYTGIMDQADGFAPILYSPAGVNTGTIIWTYTAVGTYTGTLAGAFAGYAVCTLTPSTFGGTNIKGGSLNIARASDDTVVIKTYDNTGALSNDLMSKVSFEIKVYL